MSLSCECDLDWYPDPGDHYWSGFVSDYKEFSFKKRKRCCSCKEFIEIGDLCVEHGRVKCPDSEIEMKIYGDDGEVPLASHWMCERCADIFFSLDELGYCVIPSDDMRELAKEYAHEHQEPPTQE